MYTGPRFQSPDGDSVVSHLAVGILVLLAGAFCFSPLTGIPWFPTTPALVQLRKSWSYHVSVP